jgi:DNA-directed RNA polymerase specialized sigma24 family protein
MAAGGPLARVADSSDLVQAVLYKFVMALQQGRFPDVETQEQMEKVLCRIARNEFRNLWKKERRAPRDSSPDGAGQNLAAFASSPSQHVARSELECVRVAHDLGLDESGS